MNAFLGIGVVVQGLMAAWFWLAYPDFGVVGAALEGAALLGVALMASRRARKFGARLVMAASLPFVPVGFLAMYGAIREIDRMTEEHFQHGLRRESP